MRVLCISRREWVETISRHPVAILSPSATAFAFREETRTGDRLAVVVVVSFLVSTFVLLTLRDILFLSPDSMTLTRD